MNKLKRKEPNLFCKIGLHKWVIIKREQMGDHQFPSERIVYKCSVCNEFKEKVKSQF